MFLITWNYKEPNLGTAKGKKNNRLIFLFSFFFLRAVSGQIPNLSCNQQLKFLFVKGELSIY